MNADVNFQICLEVTTNKCLALPADDLWVSWCPDRPSSHPNDLRRRPAKPTSSCVCVWLGNQIKVSCDRIRPSLMLQLVWWAKIAGAIGKWKIEIELCHARSRAGNWCAKWVKRMAALISCIPAVRPRPNIIHTCLGGICQISLSYLYDII